MTKDVLVTIAGFQYLASEDSAEPVEVVTPGQYYWKNGSHYVVYEESTEGYSETTQNLIKFSKDRLLVHKKGLTNVEMLFEKGKKTESHYETPAGVVSMGISATNFNLVEKPDRIDFTVDYALTLNDSFVADCEVRVNVQPKGGKEFRLFR